MPLTRSDTPYALLPGIQQLFMQEFAGVGTAPPSWEQYCSIVDSNKDQERYSWLGSVPKMREFTDERKLKSLIESNYSIRNRKWEDTLSIEREELEDDQYGQVRLRIQSMAQEARRHPGELATDTLMAGSTTGVCYDSMSYFSASHVTTGAEYQTTQGNYSTNALTGTNLKTAITAMTKFKDDRGRPMGVTPNLLKVPPDLEWTARELLESVNDPTATAATYAASNATNTLRGKLQLEVDPYITETDWWFLFDTTHAVKPLIYQRRTGIEFQALEGASSIGFMQDVFAYGVRLRYAIGYGLWQYAYSGQP
jgi:phage major head subunit gpT-like protein